ncbi:MAG: AMP-binding protein [Elusimicrobiota bacterium]
MNRQCLLLLAFPVSAVAGVVSAPRLQIPARLGTPAFAPTPRALALPGPIAPAASMIKIPLPIALTPALRPLAAAAIPFDADIPDTLAKAAAGEAFDASELRPTPSEPVAGSLSRTPALDASVAPELKRDGVKPPKPSPDGKTPFFLGRYGLARMILRPLVRLFYRAEISGLENLPSGPVIIVPNHISYVDAILVSFAADRPMRFMLKHEIYSRAPSLFGALGAIPVSGKAGPKAIAAALETAREAVRSGQSVVIFPEGQLTLTGAMTGFKRGFETIAADSPAPVIPAYLDGLWGSVFSMQEGPSLWSRLKELPRPVSVRFGPALAQPTAQNARLAVSELGALAMEARVRSRRRPLAREFFAAAGKSWNKPAIADSTGADLSYGRALTAALLLGRELDALLGEEKNPAVLLPPSSAGALANLALASVGRVPINLNYTASLEALSHTLKTADARTVVTSRRVLEALKSERGFELPAHAKLVLLEDVAPKIPAWKKTALYLALKVLPSSWAQAMFLSKAATSLDDPATILFTSGSSALPKGVVLTHANILSNIEMVRELIPWASREAVLGVLPFFHSFGYTLTLWMPLVSGMSAAYHSNPTQAGAISKLSAKTRATILLATPAFLQLYSRKVPASSFSSLRLVIAGAEKLRDSLAKEFQDKFGLKPYEGYGATELSPVATVGVPDAGNQKGSKPGSAGRALPGAVVKAVDPATGALMSEGKDGMLLFKGPNVMKGYLGEPAKTAEVLKDGWYVTGDIGSVDADGFTTITGRLSRFSKPGGGEMVSHTAVEEALHQAAGLTELTFVVTGVKDEKRGERLVVLYKDWNGDVGAVLAKMRDNGVPNLWIPDRRSFYKVENIPMLGSGKLDLKTVNELAARLAASDARE